MIKKHVSSTRGQKSLDDNDKKCNADTPPPNKRIQKSESKKETKQAKLSVFIEKKENSNQESIKNNDLL